MMKNRLLYALMVFIVITATLGQAATVGVAPAPAGAVAWQVPYEPVSEAVATNLRSLAISQSGSLLSNEPTLKFLATINPKLEVHRRLLSAIPLDQSFFSELEKAVGLQRVSILPDYSAAAEALRIAYAEYNVQARLRLVVNIRVNELARALANDQLDQQRLEEALAELEPFGPVSPQVESLRHVVARARERKTLDGAQRLAAALVGASAPGVVAGLAAKNPVLALKQAGSISEKKNIIDVLASEAQRSDRSDIQRNIALALANELKMTDEITYSRYIVEYLRTLAATTPFKEVQLDVLNYLIGDKEASSNRDYVEYLLDVIESVAASIPEVQKSAVGQQLRKLSLVTRLNAAAGPYRSIEHITQANAALLAQLDNKNKPGARLKALYLSVGRYLGYFLAGIGFGHLRSIAPTLAMGLLAVPVALFFVTWGASTWRKRRPR